MATTHSYNLQADEPAIVYEIMLPRKYRRKLRKVLDSFLNKKELQESPPVREIIETIDDKPEWVDTVLNQFMSVVSGYSMWQVKGRFSGRDGVVNEKTLIVRIIIPNPTNNPRIQKLASTVITFLLTRRFAEEIRMEDEIWFTESRVSLNRWVRI